MLNILSDKTMVSLQPFTENLLESRSLKQKKTYELAGNSRSEIFGAERLRYPKDIGIF